MTTVLPSPTGTTKTIMLKLTLPSWKTLLGWGLVVGLSVGLWYGPDALSMYARLALFTFGMALFAWIFTDINDTYIAVVAALVFTVAGIDQPTAFFATLGDPMIWLLLSSFIIAAGVTASGLSNRLTLAVAARTQTVNQLCYGLTLVILATAFVIPATSGRAALMVPIFLALSKAINQPRISRALALLFPTSILLSAVASLIGAGAHLVTADVVARLGGETITFGQWALLGLPFALLSCLFSTWVILHLFLTRQERTQPLLMHLESTTTGKAPLPRRGPFTAKEWYMLLTVLLLVALWSTEGLHGLNNTLVALLGALAVTLPYVELVPFKDAIKAVEWNMLLFMAASVKLGEALIESGAAQWLIEGAFQSMADARTTAPWLIIAVVATISLLSHLLITSRTARSAVLVPLVVLVGLSLGYNPVLLAFLSTAAAGFCLTLPISAKPVAMFANLDVPSYSPADLLRLSSVLLPLHLALLLGFGLLVWPALGLDLRQHSPSISATTAPVQVDTASIAMTSVPSTSDLASRATARATAGKHSLAHELSTSLIETGVMGQSALAASVQASMAERTVPMAEAAGMIATPEHLLITAEPVALEALPSPVAEVVAAPVEALAIPTPTVAAVVSAPVEASVEVIVETPTAVVPTPIATTPVVSVEPTPVPPAPIVAVEQSNDANDDHNQPQTDAGETQDDNNDEQADDNEDESHDD